MSSICQILFVLGTTDVAEWMNDVLRAARESNDAPTLYDPEQIREAMESPRLLLGNRVLQPQLEELYRRVIVPDENLHARYNRFLAILSGTEHAEGSFQQTAGRNLAPSCGFWLSKTYPDIAESAARIAESLASVTARTTLRPHSTKVLCAMLDEIDGIRADKYDADTARKILQRIENTISVVLKLLDAPYSNFRKTAGDLLSKLATLPQMASDASQSKVEELQGFLSQGLVSQDIGEGEFRAAAVEAFLLLSSIQEMDRKNPRSDPPPSGRLEWDTAPSQAASPTVGPGAMSLSEVEGMALRMIANGDIHTVVPRIIALMGGNPLAAGSTIMHACFRHRWSPEQFQPVAPLLRRAFMGTTGRTAALSQRRHSLSNTIMQLLQGGLSLVLDFTSGAKEPYGLRLARSNTNLLVVAIAQAEAQERVRPLAQGRWPKNFRQYIGWPWEIGPIAAVHGPFARRAVIVSPPQDRLLQLVLSALLAMERSGCTDVIGGSPAMLLQLDPLRRAGFTITETDSKHIDPASAGNSNPMTVIRITRHGEDYNSPPRNRRGDSSSPRTGSSKNGADNTNARQSYRPPAASIEAVFPEDLDSIVPVNDNGYLPGTEEVVEASAEMMDALGTTGVCLPFTTSTIKPS